MNPFIVILLLGVALFALFLARDKDLWWLATLGLIATLLGIQAEWIFKNLPQSFFEAIPFSPPILASWLTQLTYVGMVLLVSLCLRGAIMVIRKKQSAKP